MILTAFLLLILGALVIFTSDPTLAFQQVLFGAIGITMYFGLRSLDYRMLVVFVKPAYLAVIFLLIVTAILDIESRGSVRWIPLGLFYFQPSEFAKPVLIMALAYFWSRNYPSWKNIFISGLIFVPIGGLIFRQPDLGTTLTLLFIWFSMLVASNISVFKSLLLSLLFPALAPISWYFLHDYQKLRLTSFLSPFGDPQGVGFHVIQSMIAIGSGQIFGRGVGRGTQSRLQFLPEFRTDFIFAFIGEELGFLGSVIVLSLFALLFFYLFRFLSNIRDRFGELIIIGVFSMIFFQVVVNVGMNIGLVPVTGITLPLLSYGGSSIITTFLSLGLVASIRRFGLKRLTIERFGASDD